MKSQIEFAQKPGTRLGDAPIETEIYEKIARALDELLNDKQDVPDRKLGFALMIFPFDHSGGCSCVSNGANWRDVVTRMKEMVARLEGQPELQGRA